MMITSANHQLNLGFYHFQTVSLNLSSSCARMLLPSEITEVFIVSLWCAGWDSRRNRRLLLPDWRNRPWIHQEWFVFSVFHRCSLLMRLIFGIQTFSTARRTGLTWTDLGPCADQWWICKQFDLLEHAGLEQTPLGVGGGIRSVNTSGVQPWTLTATTVFQHVIWRNS